MEEVDVVVVGGRERGTAAAVFLWQLQELLDYERFGLRLTTWRYEMTFRCNILELTGILSKSNILSVNEVNFLNVQVSEP